MFFYMKDFLCLIQIALIIRGSLCCAVLTKRAFTWKDAFSTNIDDYNDYINSGNTVTNDSFLDRIMSEIDGVTYSTVLDMDNPEVFDKPSPYASRFSPTYTMPQNPWCTQDPQIWNTVSMNGNKPNVTCMSIIVGKTTTVHSVNWRYYDELEKRYLEEMTGRLCTSDSGIKCKKTLFGSTKSEAIADQSCTFSDYGCFKNAIEGRCQTYPPIYTGVNGATCGNDPYDDITISEDTSCATLLSKMRPLEQKIVNVTDRAVALLNSIPSIFVNVTARLMNTDNTTDYLNKAMAYATKNADITLAAIFEKTMEESIVSPMVLLKKLLGPYSAYDFNANLLSDVKLWKVTYF